MLNIIKKQASPSGAYPAIQNAFGVYDGCALWPDTLERDTFQQYNGFVTLTIEQVDGVDTVTDCVPNLEAWEAWKRALPEPEPDPGPEEPGEAQIWADMAAAITEGVNEV